MSSARPWRRNLALFERELINERTRGHERRHVPEGEVDLRVRPCSVTASTGAGITCRRVNMVGGECDR